MKQLSIVVPFYNEEKNVRLVLDAFSAFHPKYDFELICVDDGSKDDTAVTFSKIKNEGAYPFANFISYSPNQGYGNAIMTGINAASGEMLGWTHSDMQTDPADVFRAYEKHRLLSDKKLLVKGNRRNRTMPQVLLSLGMAVISSIALRMRLFEVNAQPKLFHRTLLTHMRKAPRDFSLDLYLLYQAKRNGYRIETVDVLFKDRLNGESSWGGSLSNRIRTIRRTLHYIFNINKC